MVFPLLLLMLSITYPCCNLVMLLILTHRLLLLIFTTAKSPFIFDSFLFHSRFQHKKSCHTKKAYTATKVNGENEIYAYEKRIAINAFSFVVSGFVFFSRMRPWLPKRIYLGLLYVFALAMILSRVYILTPYYSFSSNL